MFSSSLEAGEGATMVGCSSLATNNLSWCKEPSAVEFAIILAMVSSTSPLASL